MTTFSVPPVFERHADVVKVVDGDTLHLLIDVGCDTTLAMTVRLYGLNAPEVKTQEGLDAKAFVSSWVLLHEEGGFAVRTVKDRKEKYGRYLADLVPLDGTPSLCQSLLSTGHAVPYTI